MVLRNTCLTIRISDRPLKIECANKILKKLFVCEMKYMCFCRLIHCFMKSVISTRTILPARFDRFASKGSCEAGRIFLFRTLRNTKNLLTEEGPC